MKFVHVELKRDTWMHPVRKVKNPQDAVMSISHLIEDMDKEMLIAINLATNGTVINCSVISIGTVNESVVSISEIMRVAILSGGASVILVHNHPSGSCGASAEDRAVTRKVAIACQLMGLELLDHIIVGANGRFFSFKKEEENCFYVSASDYERLLIAEGE